MRKEIEKIFYNLLNLMDDYQDLPGIEDSNDKFWEYMSEHNIVADKDVRFDINILLCECEMQSEKQGFIFGFEYAVRLLTCQKEVSI